MDNLIERILVNNLMMADWRAPGGPIQFRRDLSLAELWGASFFQNTRIFLATLMEIKGASATATGNLNREFSGLMLDKLELTNLQRESARRMCKVINEMDVPDLNIIRVVCQCGRLITKRKKRFGVTPRGRELLPDGQAGELYYQLFLSFFRDFDLRYLFYLREVPSIQSTLAVSLWRLRQVIPQWRKVKGLAEQILLPEVLKELRQAKCPADSDEWILSGYLLSPLLEFGLIERQKKDEWPGIGDEDSVRITPLFDRFIRFADMASVRLN